MDLDIILNGRFFLFFEWKIQKYSSDCPLEINSIRLIIIYVFNSICRDSIEPTD